MHAIDPTSFLFGLIIGFGIAASAAVIDRIIERPREARKAPEQPKRSDKRGT
jgi:hypothetical protein